MKKKKWRDIRSTVTMMCVMLAMLSSATFAWFTLTDSPTVTGLEMKAVSSGGLMVSDASNGTYVNALAIPQANVNADANPVELKPVSPNGNGFSLPVYSGGTVTGLQTAITDTDDNLEGIVAKYTYYIKAEEGTVGVGIITGNASQAASPVVNADGTAAAAGTFIRQKENPEDGALGNGAASIRLGLVVTEVGTAPNIEDMKIYEPNVDVSNANVTGKTFAPVDANFTHAVTPDVSSNKDGSIVTGGTVGGTVSEELFQVGTTAMQVHMYVWVEGTDTDCIDQIKADVLEGQIQFISLGPVQ